MLNRSDAKSTDEYKVGLLMKTFGHNFFNLILGIKFHSTLH